MTTNELLNKADEALNKASTITVETQEDLIRKERLIERATTYLEIYRELDGL